MKDGKLHCNCVPSDCKSSDNPYECPNCNWTQCPCWARNVGLEYADSSKPRIQPSTNNYEICHHDYSNRKILVAESVIKNERNVAGNLFL